METENLKETIGGIAERLAGAAAQLESAITAMEERHAHTCGDVQRIVATAEGNLVERKSAAQQELEQRLMQAELTIASLQAQIGQAQMGQAQMGQARSPMGGSPREAAAVRRTVMGSGAQTVAKQGNDALASLQAETLDAALTGLSLEQRIAVKAQLARAGVLA
jgi:hypothetical protein